MATGSSNSGSGTATGLPPLNGAAGYMCSYRHDPDFVLYVNWESHMTQKHGEHDKNTVESAATPADAPPSGEALGSSIVIGNDRKAWALQLGLKADVVVAENGLMSSASGLLSLSVTKALYNKVIPSLTSTKVNLDKLHSAICEHLLLTDGGEVTARRNGTDWFEGDDTSPKGYLLWGTFFKEANNTLATKDVNVAPRTLARTLGPLIYDMIHQPGSALHRYLTAPPPWGRRYNDDKNWLANSSFYDFMVRPSEQSDEAKAQVLAHRNKVTKVAVDATSMIEYTGLDPGGQVASQSLRDLLNTSARNQILAGNFDVLSKLRGLMNDH